MKLKWAWAPYRDLDGNVHHEKELQYSVDGGQTWFPVGTDPKPVVAPPPPEPVATVTEALRRRRGLGPLGAKILDDAQADTVRKPRAKAPLRSKR